MKGVVDGGLLSVDDDGWKLKVMAEAVLKGEEENWLRDKRK
jgi:hypothetical protein